MKVVVPFQRLHPTTEFVLRPYQPRYVDVSEPDAYRELLAELWRARETVIIVEHDIVPFDGALEELWACPCAWGAYTYRMHGGLGIFHGLGCSKLTTQLMDAVPDVWSGQIAWNVLDQHLLFSARVVNLEPHHHRPAVQHLNERHWHVAVQTPNKDIK